MKHVTVCLVSLTLGLCIGDGATAQTPLFDEDAVIDVMLTAPISQAYAQKKEDARDYFPGHWAFTNSDRIEQRLDVSIRTRGNFRRDYCRTPPLQLNFKKSQVKGTLFAGQNKVKLVSPCGPGIKYQENVVLEYLAYQTLEILTDHSFKTRLLRLSYVDSDQKRAPWTSLVFAIEDDSDMAKRLGLQKIHLPRVEFHELDQAITAVAELFQLLIANSDYSVLEARQDHDCCHNVEIMAAEFAERGIIPIPYDFDMSGLVYSRYAAPPAHLPIKTVRTRYYSGLCQPPEILSAAIEHVRSKRTEIIALYADSKHLHRNRIDITLKYIGEFFEILDSARRTDREIISRCLGQDLLDAPE